MLFESKEHAAQSVIGAEYNHSLTVYKVPAKQDGAYNEDEVWINGKLYDVAERKIVNDTLYLSLYHDSDEESVLSVINDFFNPDQKNSLVSSPNAPLLKSIKLIPNPLYTFDILNFRLNAYQAAYLRILKKPDIVPLIFYDITTPPPRLS